jgi:hypothetical protein
MFYLPLNANWPRDQHDTTMSLTTADLKALPNLVNDDSRNLAIVYGSLGTLIAFASLIFAVLSWLKSRRQKHTTATQSSDDLELQIVDSRDDQAAAIVAIVNERYVMTTEEGKQELTLHSDGQQMRPERPANVVVSQAQLPFALHEVAAAPPRTHRGHRTSHLNDTSVPGLLVLSFCLSL